MAGRYLAQAKGALKVNNADLAIDLARRALQVSRNADQRAEAQALAVEARFRAAAANPRLEERLAHLEAGLDLQRNQARLHHHRGATLLHLGRLEEARQAFSEARSLAPDRAGLRFLQQLAAVAAGQPWDAAGLSEAEANSIQLAQALTTRATRAKLGPRFVGLPLVGTSDGLWRILLQMADERKSAPTAQLAAALAAAPRLARSPVVAYYQGAAALRAGDKEAALSIWQQLADKKALASPWFRQNNAGLTRELASRLADTQDWAAIAALPIGASAYAADSVLAEIVAAAHFHLGYAAAQAGDWPAAARHWQEANILAPGRHVAQNLALAQERRGDWYAAAVAWREMVRRRPRKADHPDYLTDSQVAAIWRHAADCYAQARSTDDEITCLKSALKYREDDADLRLRLAETLLRDGRTEAGRNELERLLAIAPDHVPALAHLAAIAQADGSDDPMPLWRRVLALDPANQDAQDGLAQCFVEMAALTESTGLFGRITKRNEKQRVKILLDGLKELPDHPILLLAAGLAQIDAGDRRGARGSLRQAWEARPTHPAIVGQAMHELLHADGDDIVEELLPSARAIPGLLAQFWLDQGRQAITCKLGERWIDRFCEEALAQSALRHGDDSPVYAFIAICEMLHHESAPAALRSRWEARARAETSHAGLSEFIDAQHAAQAGNRKKALDLLRKSRQLAEKANEPGAVRYIREIEQQLAMPLPALMDMLGEVDIDEIRRLFQRMNRRGRMRL